MTALEAAQEGSPELDRAVEAALATGAAGSTTSLDRALALAERVLPGWGWSAGGSRGEHYARIDTPDGRDFEESYAATPALALCLAILKATNPKGQPNV